jgi:hypothetical protein
MTYAKQDTQQQNANKNLTRSNSVVCEIDEKTPEFDIDRPFKRSVSNISEGGDRIVTTNTLIRMDSQAAKSNMSLARANSIVSFSGVSNMVTSTPLSRSPALSRSNSASGKTRKKATNVSGDVLDQPAEELSDLDCFGEVPVVKIFELRGTMLLELQCRS